MIIHQQPKALAEPFSQYIAQYALKGDETKKLADVLAKLRFATGLTPQELIEGSKFFQTRAGMPLGLTGLQGAEQSGRLLATLRSYGLEGGIGGRELGGFASGLTFHTKEQQKTLAELKSKHGIKLDFFDKKGQFKGFENVFSQMEKFRKLTTEQKLTFGEKLFGKEGMGIASIMMKAGVQGWNDVNARIDKTADPQQMLNQVTETYNNKMESLLGTVDNLKATTFTPMLDTLKPAIDLANQFAGNLQEFGKDHPGIAKLATEVFGVGSATLVVVGGVKSMTAAWKLWRIASSVSSEEKLIEFLKRVRTETDKTTAGIGPGAEKAVPAAKGAGGRIGNALTSAIKFAVIGFGIEAVVTELMEKGYQAVESRKAQADITDLLKERDSIEGQMRNSKISMWEGTDRINEIDAKIGEARVNASNASRTRDTVSIFADPSKFAADVAKATNPYSDLRRGPWRSTFEFFTKPFTSPFTGLPQSPSQQRSEGDKLLREDLRGMRFTSKEDLGAFLDMLRKGGQYTSQELENINRLATVEYPGFMKSLNALKTTTQETTGSLSDFKAFLDSTRPNLGGLFTGDTKNQPNSGGGNTAPPAKPSPPARRLHVKHRAMGGDVMSEGLVYIHSGERILRAADVTRGYHEPSRTTRSASSVTITGGIHIHPPKGSRMAERPNEFGKQVLKEVTHRVHLQRERE